MKLLNLVALTATSYQFSFVLIIQLVNLCVYSFFLCYVPRAHLQITLTACDLQHVSCGKEWSRLTLGTVVLHTHHGRIGNKLKRRRKQEREARLNQL